MQRIWMLRLIEVVAGAALIAEVWRFLTTNNTTQDLVVDAIELAGLLILGLICLYMERRLRRSARQKSPMPQEALDRKAE
jgi:multisubunit Na+/H+ antiporter MnhF subunit